MSKETEVLLNSSYLIEDPSYGKRAMRVGVDQSGTAFDVFGRLRVSSPFTIFDSKLVSDKQPLFYDEIVNGTATSVHNPNEASVSMSVSANNDYVIRQTFMSFNYQPGKAQYVLMTGVMGEPTANTESRIGYFNTFGASAPYTSNRDGIYFGQDGTSKYVAISKNGTENKITQDNWNVDKLDGTGESFINIDWNENQIFFIDFEWLGVGLVRFGFIINGIFRVCHVEYHTNDPDVDTGAYMSTPNHGVRYEVRSTGGSLTMKQICSSVISEGGVEESGVVRPVSNGVTPVTVSVTPVGILYIRLSADRPSTTITPNIISILNTANNTGSFRYRIVRNPTVAGTTLTWNSLADSTIEYANGVGTNTITGGTTVFEGYASGDQSSISVASNLLIRPGISINGTQDVFALVIQVFSGTDAFVGAMNITEITCG